MATFRVAQFNILGRHMAGTMWFHYARDFLPQALAVQQQDWTRAAGFPRYLLWHPEDGMGRFYRFPVLLAEIRALNADVICMVELDCFAEFREALHDDGYDAVFHGRPGKADGCGIFWRREVFTTASPSHCLEYTVPQRDRIAVAQPLRHLASKRNLIVASTHLYWDQSSGHQATEVRELLAFVRRVESAAGVKDGAALVCGDLNTLPGTDAYEEMCKRFQDAAVQTGSADYPSGAFTSVKPDIYYFARPRGCHWDPAATEQWHFQEGRQEVLDYVFYDPGSFEVEATVQIPCLDCARLDGEQRAKRRKIASKKPPYGFWAGGWSFVASPAPGFQSSIYNSKWQPRRARGELQFGIPNRVHGSDHIPVVATLRFLDQSLGAAASHIQDLTK